MGNFLYHIGDFVYGLFFTRKCPECDRYKMGVYNRQADYNKINVYDDYRSCYSCYEALCNFLEGEHEIHDSLRG